MSTTVSARESAMHPEPYYDPYDFEIDANPHPVWKRLRDERPLYWKRALRILRVEPLGRVALDEVLKRFPSWEVDRDHAVQARTSTVRGWESLPVFTAR